MRRKKKSKITNGSEEERENYEEEMPGKYLFNPSFNPNLLCPPIELHRDPLFSSMY